MLKRTLKGFTLVELLVVIAIIGLLSTVAVVSLNSARAKSRDAKRIADVKQIQTALELFYNDKNDYPATPAAALGTGTITNLTLGDAAGANGGFGGTAGTSYMGLIPRDPGKATSDVAAPCGATAPCDYAYTRLTTTTYKLQFALENATAGLPAGALCATQDGLKGGACP